MQSHRNYLNFKPQPKAELEMKWNNLQELQKVQGGHGDPWGPSGNRTQHINMAEDFILKLLLEENKSWT